MTRRRGEGDDGDRHGVIPTTAVPEMAEIVREAASLRPERPEKAPEIPAVHFIPMEGDTNAAFDAAGQIEEARVANLERLERERAEEGKDYTFFLRCRESHTIGGRPAPPDGLYFTKNPHDELVGDHDWYARYKTVDQVWRQEILCQVCLMMGREVPLPLQWTSTREGKWRPEPRFICKKLKDTKAWIAAGGGWERANPLPGESRNLSMSEQKAMRARDEKRAQEASRGS